MKMAAIAALAVGGSLLYPADYPQSNLRLLDLDVVAFDNHGQPVTDMTADDFQITDAGRREKVAYFRKNDESGQPNGSLAQFPARFSNRTDNRRPNATAILFDLLNMGYGTRSVAANQLVHDLSASPAAGNLYLYLLSINGKLLALHGVPPLESPHARIAEAPWTQQIKPLMDAALRAVIGFRSPDMDVFVRTQFTFAALEAVGGELAAIPGRKSIVWVTDGVPVALGMNRSDTGLAVDFRPLIRQLSQALERSKIALYPVSQILLGGADDIGAFSGVGQTGGGGTGVQSLATLDLFADLTGGRRSTARHIGAVVQQAMDNLRFSYQIGYYVSPENWDDKFHKLRVTSSRKGVRIQAKAGYYAWKGAAGTRTQSAFTATAASPYDAEEIGLRANVSADPANPAQALVNLQIDTRDIALAEAGDRYAGHLGIMAVSYLPNGLISPGPLKPLDIDYSAAERDHALQDGIRVVEKLSANQGESRFRIMVFDRGSNAVGSITIPASALPPARP